MGAERSPLRWLDHMPLIPLAVGAIFLGLAPLLPEPHLWQKLKLLAAGQLTRPLDVLDLFMHASLPLLLGVKLLRASQVKRPAPRAR